MRWFTNLDYPQASRRPDPLQDLHPDEYPTYDNYDAIEVSKTKDIPADYAGAMGVPITFLDKYNPDQFEIVGITQSWYGAASKSTPIRPRSTRRQRKHRDQAQRRSSI